MRGWVTLQRMTLRLVLPKFLNSKTQNKVSEMTKVPKWLSDYANKEQIVEVVLENNVSKVTEWLVH